MVLYLSGSNRMGNCYTILKSLKSDNDKLIALADKKIEFCKGCNACVNGLNNFCIIDDDMQEIYQEILKTNKIVIASPIYMNHISGILKNLIDRLNPYSSHDELLKGKTIYLITVGQMAEDENAEIAEEIKKYFESIGEFMEFKTVFLKNFTSGDIEELDDVTKAYDNFENIIDEIRNKIAK